MKTTKLLFFILMLFSHLYSLTITMKKVAKINQEEILLIDLVESFQDENESFEKIQNLIIATLPYQNRMMNIASQEVLNIIKLSQPNFQVSIPNMITAVRWEELTLKLERIQIEAKEYINNSFHLPTQVEINFINTPKVSIPSEDVLLVFSINPALTQPSHTRLDASVFYGNKKVNTFSLNVKIEAEIAVLQAKRSIKKGEQIDKQDFRIITLKTNPINVFVDVLEDDVELIANNFIGQGAYLKRTDLLTKPPVKINSLVNVVVKSNTISLTQTALSRNNGWIGDLIWLQNIDSKQNFQAVVIDYNKVLINLED